MAAFGARKGRVRGVPAGAAGRGIRGTAASLRLGLLVALLVGALLVLGGSARAVPPPATGGPSFAVGSGPPADALAPAKADAVPGELIVRFRWGVSRAAQSAVLSREEVSLVERLLLPRTALVRVPKGESVAQAVAALEQRPDVAWAEPNVIQHIYDTTPDDPRFGELWGLDNTGQTVNGTAGTADADIDAPEAWDTQTGSAGVVVAVIDTGISFAHPELSGRIWNNPGEVGGGKATNGSDDDGNGYVDDYRGWSFVEDNNNPIDGNEHGTHVAGTIGAAGNNGIGVAGVNWNVRIMPVQVCDRAGSCATDAIVDGIMYAGANGASIANMSLGGSVFSRAERDAIAANADTLYVVAAGNDGLDLSYDNSYPCEFPLENIVCVAASTQTDAMADFSNYGVQSVDLAAPGENILSTIPAYDTIFSDDFEGAAKWDYTDGIPEGTKWERTTESYVSPTHSITDSAGGNYGNSADAIVTMASPFSLVGQSECHVDYEMKLDSEYGWDGVLVEAKSASGSWTDLDGWSGHTGGAYYTFNSDLSAFSGDSAVYLRFEFVSDATLTYDGAHIDDVRVLCPAKSSASYSGDEYGLLDGTSMATPHVTGAAALLEAQEPKATPGRIKAALLGSVDPLTAFAATTVSGGRLNVAAALAAIGTTPEPAPTTQAALDTSFGSGGTVTTSFGTTDDRAFAMAEQSDGKLVVVGRSGAGGAGVFAVARYNADGSLDADFGADGLVTTAVGSGTGESDYDEARAVAIQSDGKIVVAGVASNSSGYQDFAVVRYESDGDLDTTFSGDGMAFANNNWDEAWAVALQGDGKIVVAGKTGVISDAMIVRFNADGTLDSTFGAGGQVVTTFGSDSLKYHEFRAVAMQDDGKIVAAGYTEVGSDRYFALARFNSDGSLDTGFDEDGKVTTDMDPGALVTGYTGADANAVLVQGDGKIVAAGGAFGSSRFALARYESDGGLDTSLEGDGTLTTDVSPPGAGSQAYALALDATGNLVAAGVAQDRLADTLSNDFGVARFADDGSPDAYFNGDGMVTTPIAADPGDDVARGLVLESDGAIVAAGYSDTDSSSSTDYDFSLVRYVPDADAAAPAPPVFTRSDPASPANSTTPTIAGSAESGSVVDLYGSSDCSGDPVASGPVVSGGGRSLHRAAFLSGFLVTVSDNATTTFSARDTDAAGNESTCSDPFSYTADSLPPDTTIDSGPDGPTNDATPTFAFSSTETGSSFECSVDSAGFAACSSPYTSGALVDGEHTFAVQAVDAAGNADETADGRSFTVDTVAPVTTIDSGPSGPTNDATPAFTFSSEAGATLQCRITPAAFAGCSSPYSPTLRLTDGSHTFYVRATDAAGNLSTPGRSFTVDTVPPQTRITAGPSGPTNDATPTFSFSSDPGASFRCRVDSGSFTACRSPWTRAPALAQGPHAFYVKAIDAAGNSDATPASRSFLVDTNPPDTAIVAAPGAATKYATQTFRFRSSDGGAHFQCKLDRGTYATCSSPKTYGPLANGVHIFSVRAIDAAGNTDGTPAVRKFLIDTVAPQTAITVGPPAATTSRTPAFQFSSTETGSTFQCKLDTAAWVACSSPKKYSGLATGTHTFSVRATDAAGNVDATPAKRTWKIAAS